MRMRKALLYSLLPGVLLSCSVAAMAGTVTLTYTGPGGANDGSYYVYPYNFKINGSSSQSALLCDTFTHEITQGESWTATTSTFADLSHTLFGSGNAVSYQEAGWLFNQLGSHPSQSQAIGINYAIWGLFDRSDPKVTGSASYATYGSASWASQAATAIQNGLPSNYFNNLVIYTPTANPNILPISDQRLGSPQEFIGNRAIPTPEPGTLFLLVTGLATICAFFRNKRNQRRLIPTTVATVR